MKMEEHREFHRDDLLDRAVDAVLHEPTPDDVSPDRVKQLAAAVWQAAERPYPITIITRIKNMRPITRIAVAASVLAALLGLMSWLLPGGGASLAFADMAEALKSVHSATWKSVSVVKREVPEKETTTWNQVGMFLAPSHERTEMTVPGQTFPEISIMDRQQDKTLVLHPRTKTATVINIKNMPKGEHCGTTFQDLRSLVAMAQSGKGEKLERLGVKTIDGRPAEGFHFQIGVTDVKIWADPKTSLPIRVENTTLPGVSPEVRIVMTDFQIDVDLDESLFSLDMPKGYTLGRTMEMDMSRALKNPLVFLGDSLKIAAEYNSGVFPDTLQGKQGIDGILFRAMPEMVKKYGKDVDGRQKVTTDLAMTLSAAFGFLGAIPPDDLHYAGKGIKLGTPNRPIFWAERKRDGRCMVLYADLSYQEVSKEEASKFPQPEAKPKP
jgi:outer membrane lipoprotein-sorting protein